MGIELKKRMHKEFVQLDMKTNGREGNLYSRGARALQGRS